MSAGHTGEIPVWECERLLADHTTGRICVLSGGYPLALPVSYHWTNVGGVGRRILMRTRLGNTIAAATGPASFELDHIDEIAGKAWSVIARGTLQEVHEMIEVPELRRWLMDGRGHLMELEVSSVSGRRFVSHMPGDDSAVVEWQLAG
jgi:nitroimidazol reductase NimA-like FMN-containing flavoprotein (pyridoxamine 5'-phosphate oxidase superfamily)